MPQHGTLNSKGFTLIEVMIAITVFALGILAVMSMQTTSITTNATANRISTASKIASEMIEDLIAKGYDHADLAAGTRNLTSPSSDYTVSVTITADTPAENTKTIVLTTTHTVTGKTVQLTNIMADPL